MTNAETIAATKTHFPELRCPVCRGPADQVVQTPTGYVDACLEHTAALASGEVSS